MSDPISRQDVIDTLETVGYDFSNSELSETELIEVCEAVGEVRQDMINRIKRMPSAQPELIRCKDCRWWGVSPSSTIAPTFRGCRGFNHYTEANEFCSRAERRE